MGGEARSTRSGRLTLSDFLDLLIVLHAESLSTRLSLEMDEVGGENVVVIDRSSSRWRLELSRWIVGFQQMLCSLLGRKWLLVCLMKGPKSKKKLKRELKFKERLLPP